jgi:hypothetical protein
MPRQANQIGQKKVRDISYAWQVVIARRQRQTNVGLGQPKRRLANYALQNGNVLPSGITCR